MPLQVLTRSKLLNVKLKHFLDLEMRASKTRMISLIDLIFTCKNKVIEKELKFDFKGE